MPTAPHENLFEPYDGDNIFAKILRGDMPCHRIFENDHTLCFLDAYPQSAGHTLVIHKHEPASNLLHISANGLHEVITSVQHVSQALIKALQPSGLIVQQFNGAHAGQTVFHFHMHIIPRYESEALQSHARQEHTPDPRELAAIALKISDHLPQR